VERGRDRKEVVDDWPVKKDDATFMEEPVQEQRQLPAS
jgi:hypothetical protein